MVDCVGKDFNKILPPVKYEKSDTFKKIGTFAGATALLPAAVNMGFNQDLFKYIKNGPNLGDYIYVTSKSKTVLKIYDATLKLFAKSKGLRIAYVAAICAGTAGLFMGLGRLLGAIPDAIINMVRKHKAEKPQVIY